MFYFIKTPALLRLLYPECTWHVKTAEKVLYLTFDDGPNPLATTFILEQLNKYNALATFFCIGKNVEKHFDIYENVITAGHAVGNHTFDHLNGWKTKDAVYLENIFKAKQVIDSNLFRPPYGRITKFQLSQLKAKKYAMRTIMWDVLSGDFDPQLSEEHCFLNVTRNAKQGSIVVFHDSENSIQKLRTVLPGVLDHFARKGYQFKIIG
ncbi:MAG: polysaccharide deacetylase family protein [Ginsengibacter sp.]